MMYVARLARMERENLIEHRPEPKGRCSGYLSVTLTTRRKLPTM